MKRLAWAAALAALALAGCGSTHHTAQPVRLVNGHFCSPADEALQCVLPPQKVGGALNAPRAVAFGVDFAWGAPTAAWVRSQGYKFGASYLSHDPAKGWAQRPGLVSEYHRAGLATVAVWETTANRAAQGRAAGEADAREARRQAAGIGNTASTIYFAIDFDATGGQVNSYFQGVHSVLGNRAGAYGGYRPLGYLCAHGLIGKGWQTYAWSGGAWLPASCAPLEQYLNGSTVDYDRAIAADYGQWPAPAEPASNRVAKQRLLNRERQRIYVWHSLIDHHKCRPGQHATPASYHGHACPTWLARGQHAHRAAARLEHELRRHQ